MLPTPALTQAPPVVTERPSIVIPPIGAALAAIALAAFALQQTLGWRQSSLFLVGAGAGIVLYHAAFGFTSAWRVFITDRRSAGIRAQMLMLGLACLVFFPALASGQWFGHPVRGSASPIGVSVLVGAFIFGIGMQLGGGCASGTLYTAGGGNLRMVVTLLAFIAGSVVGVAHLPWWERTPSLRPISLVATLGPWVGLLLNLALFLLLAKGAAMLERKRHGAVQSIADSSTPAPPSVWRGPWPLAAGAVGLALVNILTLAIAGRPWGVTSAFALWGSKLLALTPVDVASWEYWSAPARAAELKASVFNDVTTVMNLGIMLGAFAAAGFAGRFAPSWRVPRRSLIAALIGGLLLGYGARLAYGCNIGAYFSGIASGSVHGWVWLVAAFVGNAVGARFRPYFGLSVERTR